MYDGMVLRHPARLFYPALILFAVTSLLYPQQRENNDLRFRLAQSYDRSGDFQAAIKIYKDLLTKDPLNTVILNALRQDYVQLKMYDSAMVILQGQLKRNPADVSLHCELASMYYLNSSETKAVEEWDRAIAVSPKQAVTYQAVAGSMTQNRLFDRAIDVYLRARKATSTPKLFTGELAYLYSITSKYEDATREYLSFLGQDPLQTGYVQTQIGSYTSHPEGLAAATRVIEDTAKSSSNNLPVLRVLAWVYMEGKHYDRAYDVSKAIDEKANAAGHELASFAQRALHDKSFTVAATAFRDVMDHYPKFDRLAEVKFGYAQSLEASDEEQDTLRLFGRDHPFTDDQHSHEREASMYAAAVNAYEQVVKEFPATENAARSALRIAILEQEKYFDLAAARQSLEQLVRAYAKFPQVMMEGALRLGDIDVLLGRLDDAGTEYRTLAGKGLRINPIQDRAALRLGELQYFRENFDSALTILGDLGRNANSDVANDAIGLQAFIQESLQGDKPALKVYAHADLLRRQKKFLDALSAYQSIIQSFPKSSLVDEATMSIGDIYTLLGRYPEALTSYQRLMTDYPESITLDQALMKIGEVYQNGLKDSAKAIASYQTLLEKFPLSIYVSEARKSIRELRGDAI